jgi:hypothetical protein
MILGGFFPWGTTMKAPATLDEFYGMFPTERQDFTEVEYPGLAAAAIGSRSLFDRAKAAGVTGRGRWPAFLIGESAGLAKTGGLRCGKEGGRVGGWRGDP